MKLNYNVEIDPRQLGQAMGAGRKKGELTIMVESFMGSGKEFVKVESSGESILCSYNKLVACVRRNKFMCSVVRRNNQLFLIRKEEK